MANKVSTKSYCIKRLRDCGFIVNSIDNLNYPETDKRKWSILIDNGCASIIMTCFKSGSVQFYDGRRYMNHELKRTTESVEVLVEFLNERGIVNKHKDYGQVLNEVLE